MREFDSYSYHCGVMDAFAEVVSAGVKKLALSHPFSSKEELNQCLPYAMLLCEQYQISCYQESELLITDLFPYSLNKGFHTIIFYQKQEYLDQYLQLKREKKLLIETGTYTKEKRQLLACAFGELLSYNEESCQRKIDGNTEKEEY